MKDLLLLPWRRANGDIAGDEPATHRPPGSAARALRDALLGELTLEPVPLLPRVDVLEHEGRLVVEAELPGFDPEDVELELRGGELHLRGERRAAAHHAGADFHLMERSFGRFTRVLSLPAPVDPDSVEARFHQGVLIVHLRLRERRVEVPVRRG